jgi:flagellar hook protein FlgE
MSGNIMNAAVMGMNAQTSWLATISQNIANSNTTGYKDAETEFSSLVNPGGTTNYSAGGVATSTLSMNSMQGGVVGTSTVTDLAVQGNGFFVVSNAAGDTFLTRNGSFVPDASGNLINSAGYYLMGANVQSNTTPVANSLAGLQKVNINQTGEQATPTTSGTFSANLPSMAAIVPAANTPAGVAAAPPTVPPTIPTYTEKTSLVTYDNLGAPVTLDVYMTNVSTPAIPANPAATPPTAAVPASYNWEVDVYNSADAAPGGGFPYSTPALTTQTLNFDPTSGQLAGASSLNIAIPNGKTMTLSMAGTTQLATGYAVTGAATNGNAPDTLTGVTISTDGTLSFNYSSGTSMPGYDIPLANVASPDNLTSVNGTVFSTNINSGQPQVGKAGTAGFGAIESSSLEDSTVDLATELTAMIQSQSSYEANSKVFQTGANLLDILNKIQA